jgi:hypothetical protein
MVSIDARRRVRSIRVASSFVQPASEVACPGDGRRVLTHSNGRNTGTSRLLDANAMAAWPHGGFAAAAPPCTAIVAVPNG